MSADYLATGRAGASPPPKLPANVCPDCRMLRCEDGQPWDLGTHCPSTLHFEDYQGLAKLVAERDCLRIGIDKARANETRMRILLATVGEALDAAIAATGEAHG